LVNLTPCITIIDENHHKSQSNAPHFQHLKSYGLLYEVQDVSKCTDLIKQLIEKGESDNKKEQNKRFIKDFIRPYGFEKSAGYISARLIELIGEGFTVDKIKEQLSNF
jgi:polyhydroxyalkanoate synthesis regulator phasin